MDAAPGARRHAVATVIEVTEDEDASHSEVFIQTRDRPGLLTDIVRTLKDSNVNVVSAEVRRMGLPLCDRMHGGSRAVPHATVVTRADVCNTFCICHCYLAALERRRRGAGGYITQRALSETL